MKPLKVLLVDDDEDDYILTRDILKENPRSENYELSWCDNFSAAINAMLKQHYDVYLVDYRLGKYSGMDILKEAIASNCTQPIIILTGKGDLKIDEEALKLGAADYLVKDNIDSNSLERAIRYAVGHSNTLQKLKESENKFRIVFERSKDPMIVTDPTGKIHEVNSAACSFFGQAPSRLVNMNAAELYADPAARENFTGLMEENGAVTDFESAFVTALGEQRLCSVSSFIHISQHGTSERYYNVIHDLTNIKLREQESLLSEKARTIERMTKALAFEIRNPLSNVNLALDELYVTLKGKDESSLLDIVKNNTQRIALLINELIACTQPTLLDLQEIDVGGLLSDSALAIESSSLARVQVGLPPQPLAISADEEKLKIALQNILKNATEAINGSAGQVKISVEQKPPHVVFHISDTGGGIPPENLNQVFEPFFTTKSHAAGLGLTHAQQIIQAHEGRISIRSSEQGTMVSCYLPAKT